MKKEIAEARKDLKDIKDVYEALIKAEGVLEVAAKAELRLEEVNQAISIAGDELENLRDEKADIEKARGLALEAIDKEIKAKIEDANKEAEKIVADAKNEATKELLASGEKLEALTGEVKKAQEHLDVLLEELAEARVEKETLDAAIAKSKEAVKTIKVT